MSFDANVPPTYDNHALKVAKSLNLNAKRTDGFFMTHHVMSDVWEGINAARRLSRIALVATRTSSMKSVWRTHSATVILIAEHSRDVPFDLQAIRFIQYEYAPPGMEGFEKQLTSTSAIGIKPSIGGFFQKIKLHFPEGLLARARPNWSGSCRLVA
jgi:hypothetical protein